MKLCMYICSKHVYTAYVVLVRPFDSVGQLNVFMHTFWWCTTTDRKFIDVSSSHSNNSKRETSKKLNSQLFFLSSSNKRSSKVVAWVKVILHSEDATVVVFCRDVNSDWILIKPPTSKKICRCVDDDNNFVCVIPLCIFLFRAWTWLDYV